MELTLVSYNIHSGIGTDGRFDLHRVAEVLSEIDADIIALQEVGVRIAERVQESEKTHLGPGRRIAPTQQQHATVELPARHEHVSPCRSRARIEGAVVVSRVDQNPGIECHCLPPGVPADPDDRCYRFHQQSLADRERWSRG